MIYSTCVLEDKLSHPHPAKSIHTLSPAPWKPDSREGDNQEQKRTPLLTDHLIYIHVPSFFPKYKNESKMTEMTFLSLLKIPAPSLHTTMKKIEDDMRDENHHALI